MAAAEPGDFGVRAVEEISVSADVRVKRRVRGAKTAKAKKRASPKMTTTKPSTPPPPAELAATEITATEITTGTIALNRCPACHSVRFVTADVVVPSLDPRMQCCLDCGCLFVILSASQKAWLLGVKAEHERRRSG